MVSPDATHMQEFINNICDLLIIRREKVISVFKVVYSLLIFFIILAFLLSRLNNTYLLFFYSLGSLFGKSALVAYLLTLVPGIGERLGAKNKPLSLLRIFRRYVGILMYLLALLHVVLSKLLFVASLNDLLPQGIFEIMGLTSLFILFFLFITSNNISLSRFRINWYRIQRLTYGAMFFIFLHVSFLRLSIWSVLMGILIIAQVISFAVIYIRTRSLTGGKPI